MKIKNYIEYFKYILEHKKNVFKTCWKRKLYIHAFTHDLSKFLPSEFIPYARYFYIDKVKYKEDFEKAWEQHYLTNKHHWNYWIGLEMPRKYILQMVCDWEAMSLKFGDTAQAFYLKNYNKIKLHRQTRWILECILEITNFPFQVNDEYLWMTLEEITNDIRDYREKHPKNYSYWLENKFIPYYKERYGVDISNI